MFTFKLVCSECGADIENSCEYDHKKEMWIVKIEPCKCQGYSFSDIGK
jgi:hypothetical protein